MSCTRWLFCCLVVLSLAACDGIATGQKTMSVVATDNVMGGYGPMKLQLTPQMSPLALNMRAEHGINPADVGKWNAYIATLTFNGREVAASKFHINYTGSADGQPGAPSILQNMLTARITEAGDYELTIAPTKTNEVKLTNVKIEMRENVQGNANAR